MKLHDNADETFLLQQKIFSEAKQQVSQLFAFREAFPPMPLPYLSNGNGVTVINPITGLVNYSKVLPFDGKQGDPRLSQRLGDLYLGGMESVGLHAGQHLSTFSLLCACGAQHSVSRSTLSRFVNPIQSMYFPPVSTLPMLDKRGALEDPSEHRVTDISPQFLDSAPMPRPFTCPHITANLKAAFPQVSEILRKIRNHVAQRSLGSEGTTITAPWSWFRRDIGLYLFLRDVGLPPKPNMTLRRTVSKNVYEPKQFYWHQWGVDKKWSTASPGTAGSQQEAYSVAVLKQRMISARARAKKLGVPFLFQDFNHYMKAVSPLPEGFVTAPDTFSVKFQDQMEKGIGPDNLKWIRRVPNQRKRSAAEPGPAVPANDGLALMSKVLKAESDTDFFDRIMFLGRELDKLNSQELYCADPDFAQHNGKPRRDVYATLLRKVRDARFDEV